MSSNRYAQRGVSAQKEDVHQAIKKIDKGLFPQAFCKVVPDHLTGSQEHALVMHADGAGTKSSLAYMYWNYGRLVCLGRDCSRCIGNEFRRPFVCGGDRWHFVVFDYWSE